MALSIQDNFFKTELLEKEHTSGRMEAAMKERLKMVYDMDMENMWQIKQRIKAHGLMVLNQAVVKSYLKVEVYLKDASKTMLNRDMEKCTIILQATISKDSGKMMSNVEWERWIGQI